MVDQNPILNSPFEPPTRHWLLNEDGALSKVIKDGRRRSEYVVPVPPSKKKIQQGQLPLDATDAEGRTFTPNTLVNEVREHVARWRELPPSQWGVTHETARLLDQWRSGQPRPPLFFCQIEAAETIIWLEEVARRQGRFQPLSQQLRAENDDANPGLFRLAAKMATGSGKTTVMAMLIAWQAINAARGRKSFSDAFLIVCPGITIKDRLRVLLPSDPENYYQTRGLVPDDMIGDVRKVRIVITNYHAFKNRETLSIPKFAREVLAGRGEEPSTVETDGQTLARVCPELLGRKNVIVINDEAHHCYQEKPGKSEENQPTTEERDEVTENKKAARLWINGIKSLKGKVGVRAVYDLSATPFFLRGSGYSEGTLFPWVVCDFSLMDAIECGIVKIPRVPVSDNALGYKMPVWRKLWPEIREDLPKKGAKKAVSLDPEALPEKLLGALHALYEHYEKIFEQWQPAFGKAGLTIPPVFIVVCQNTSHSKLLYDYIAGYERTERTPAGEERAVVVPGRLELFNNYDEDRKPRPRPRTLLIDSNELDSGEKLSPEFRRIAVGEIEAFKTQLSQRFGQSAAECPSSGILRQMVG